MDPEQQQQIGETHFCDCGLARNRPRVCGVNIDPRNTEFANPTVDQLLELGIKRVRFVFKRGDPNSPIEDAFSVYDGPMGQYTSNDIGVLVVINQETLWTDDDELFSDTAAAVAAHCAQFGVREFEIWNEENLAPPNAWLDPTAYGLRLGLCATKIHAVVEGAKVSVGGLGMTEEKYDYVDAVRAAAGDAWGQVDAVSIHVYAAPTSGLGEVVRQFSSRYGKPVWLTEWGDPALETQVAMMSSYFTWFGQSSSRLLDAAYYFGWNDTQDGPYTFYGLFDAQNQRKETWTTFQHAARGREVP